MEILLIYPYFLEERIHEGEISVLPIGLYYLAAMLKDEGHEVEIWNCYKLDDPGQLEKELSEKGPDVIGFSVFHANRWGGIEMARQAKEVHPGAKVIFGGPGATFLWRHLLENFKEIDFVVLGEGEKTFLELVGCIQRSGVLNAVKGLAYRKGGMALRTEKREPVANLDSLANPAKYFVYQHVSSSRGCPGKCAFCGSPSFWGNKVRFHSPGYFADQLELLYKKGVKFFYFSDDMFTLKEKRVVDICREILKRDLKITWAAISSVNHVSEEILYWMRKAGCIQISYGVESGSGKIRGVLNKKISSERIKKAFELTRSYGIMARAYFIYGSPGETWETINETLSLIREIKPLSIIFYILDIFPGTGLYEDYKKGSGNTDDMWLERMEDIMYWETDKDLSRDLVLAFGEWLRNSYYKMLPEFAKHIELTDKKELYPHHSEFCSRLAMTFNYGDYASIDTIEDKEDIAEGLYKKALDSYPNSSAYLGLAIIYQKKGRYRDSIKLLEEGINYFQKSESLHMCLGVSFMNLGDYNRALWCFLDFQHSEKALHYIASCYRALGDFEKEAAFRRKIQGS